MVVAVDYKGLRLGLWISILRMKIKYKLGPLCHLPFIQVAIKFTYELKSTRGFFHANVRVNTLILTYSSSDSETVVESAVLNCSSRKINENLTYLETRRIYSHS